MVDGGKMELLKKGRKRESIDKIVSGSYKIYQTQYDRI